MTRRSPARLIAAAALLVGVAAASAAVWAATKEWPPPGETISPLSQRLVEPHSVGSSTSSLQVVLELAAGREATFQKVAISYHIGGHHYRLVFPLAVRACAPTVSDCSAPQPPSQDGTRN